VIDNLFKSNIAIIGGGKTCKLLLQFLLDKDFLEYSPAILGVAEADNQAEGLQYATQMGLFTTADYRDLFGMENLQLLVEVTDDPTLSDLIRRTKPAGVQLIDHIEARDLWSSLQLELEKRKALKELAQKGPLAPEIRSFFEQFADRLSDVIKRRHSRYLQIERELVENEQTLSQIVQGSTIPTFVIDKNHVVTHWNRALERLSGTPAEQIVGTCRQWMPFWRRERPTMADVILDQIDEEEIKKLYGRKWRKSALIEGAYEAEIFFPNLGENGKWCWFTAAPIKSPDGSIIGAIETLWDRTEEKLAEQSREKHTRLLTETAKELAKSEQTLSQIIQGSTMPTFVIDRNHRVTHWNRALEKLTGTPAEKVVGTNKQWMPFYRNERHTMADVIVDQVEESEIRKLYGSKWRKSALIEGAYEAEGFFSDIGQKGRWFWFTAAPIKSPVGHIIGAIETLWDKTEDKRAEEEREKHTQELSTLCSIYTALNAPADIFERIQSAIQEVKTFLAADGICIYLAEDDGNFHLRYSDGISDSACRQIEVVDQSSIIHHVAQTGEFTIFEELPEGCTDEICFLEQEKLISLAYIPISTKDKRTFGVIRIGSRQPKHFSHRDRHVLELIGNRIGVAIENAMLQEQYIKSEKKYRTLFNSDPHPIFILDSRTFSILDTNQRAQDSYGYTRDELLGRMFLELGDESDEELAEALDSLSRDRSLLFTKRRHYRKGGKLFYVNVNISHAKYGESDVVIASTTDITESVEKETQLVQASKMTTLGQMAAGIAHEINQPLNVIQVCADYFTKMIERGQAIAEEDMMSMTQDIVSNVQRASGIIQHMRDFARQSEVVRSKVSINDPIRDVFKVLGHQLKIHEVQLQLDLDPNIPFIMADHNRLEQVFINLVTNALDAMDEKSNQTEYQNAEKTLTIRSFAENGQVVVTVADTGTGMSPDVIAKLFEPFFTTKKVGKGTGLGVSISYGIVRDYDGDIDIDSRVGEGTTFTLRFPGIRDSGQRHE
jgi:PAS domain S-box-containing protein